MDLDTNDTIRYSIIWGDQTSIRNESGILPSNTSYTARHHWIVAGNYTITVTAYDSVNASEITTYIIRIDPKPSTPGFELLILLSALVIAVILLGRKKQVK
jgi:hypothetical protein